MVRGRAMLSQWTAGETSMTGMRGLLIPGNSTTEVMLEGMRCGRGSLCWRGTLVVLNDTVLSWYSPLLGSWLRWSGSR